MVVKKMPDERIPWDRFNFKEIKDPNGKKRSLCLTCGQDFSSHYYEFFCSHQSMCEGPKAQKTKLKRKRKEKENDQNFANRVSLTPTSTSSITRENSTLNEDLEDTRMDCEDEVLSSTLSSLEDNHDATSSLSQINSQNNDMSENNTIHSLRELQSTARNQLLRNQRSNSFGSNHSQSNMKSQTEVQVSIIRFMLSQNIDLDSIESPHARSMFKLLNPELVLPTACVFKKAVLDKAISLNYSNDLDKTTKNFIELLTFDNNFNFYALTTLVFDGSEHIFLKMDKFDRPSDLNEENDFIVKVNENVERQWLLDFCTKSIKIASQSYDTEVAFILHDGNFDLPLFNTVKMDPNKTQDTDRIYVLFRSLNEMVERLLELDLPSSIKRKELNESYDRELFEVLQFVKTCSLSECTQKMFDFIESNALLNDIPPCKATFLDEFLSFITSMHLLANYLNPKFHGDYVRKDPNLLNYFSSFITSAGKNQHVPATVLDGLGYYKDKDCLFKKLFDGSLKENPKKIWMSVKVQKQYRPLSEYAIALLNVPSCTRRINMENLIAKLEMYPEISGDGFRSLLYALSMVEKDKYFLKNV